MVTVAADTTVEQFVELLRSRPFSRVPVFEGSIDNIVGLVYAKDVLQVPDSEAHNRTVGSLMRRDLYFVPETKLASDLLRELQKKKVRMAIVIDEYGGVAGLVTIEDVVEEIVGEISDEHEIAQVVRENEHSYLVPGNMDVDRLEELLGVRPERKGAATVAGLVSELAGRIPQKGEVIEEDGLRLEVAGAQAQGQREAPGRAEDQDERGQGGGRAREETPQEDRRQPQDPAPGCRANHPSRGAQRGQIHTIECTCGGETRDRKPQATNYAESRTRGN